MQSYSKSELRQIIAQINSLYPHVDALVTTLMENCADAFGYPMPADAENNETDILQYISDDDLHQCLHDLHEIGSLVGKVQHGTLETETVKPYLVTYLDVTQMQHYAVVYLSPKMSLDSANEHIRSQVLSHLSTDIPHTLYSVQELDFVEGD